MPAKLVFKDGRAHHSLQEAYDRKGNKVIYIVTASPYLKKGRKIQNVIEMALDVTKTFLLEQKLKETLEFQQVIIQNAIDGIIASNKEGIINIYNPAAKELLKYPTTKIVGKKGLKRFIPQIL